MRSTSFLQAATLVAVSGVCASACVCGLAPQSASDGGAVDGGAVDSGSLDGGAFDAGTITAAKLPTDALLVSGAAGPVADPCAGQGPDFNIGVMRYDGGTHWLFDGGVNGPGDELWPRLSPDRTRFVYYRAPVGKSSELCRYELQELWVANVDGTGARPAFSHDDKKRVANDAGWPLHQTYQGHADWAPDSRHLVMFMGFQPPNPLFPTLPDPTHGLGNLYVLDVDTGALRQVTDRKNDAGFGQSGDPSITPDGQDIIFFGCPDAMPAGCAQSQMLAVPFAANKAKSTRVVFDGGGNDVYVSRDGRHILWMSNPLLIAYQINVAPYSAGQPIDPGLIKVVEPWAGGYANWAPDSGTLVYGYQHWIYVNHLNGKPSSKLSPEGAVESFRDPSP